MLQVYSIRICMDYTVHNERPFSRALSSEILRKAETNPVPVAAESLDEAVEKYKSTDTYHQIIDNPRRLVPLMYQDEKLELEPLRVVGHECDTFTVKELEEQLPYTDFFALLKQRLA